MFLPMPMLRDGEQMVDIYTFYSTIFSSGMDEITNTTVPYIP
jgi:hypothetical protein